MLAGVLYLDDGGDKTACTQFYDVRGQKAELGPQQLGGGDSAQLFRPVFGGTNAQVQVCPQVGTLVLFPAWLQHAVLPHKGDRTRLTVSWNLVLVRMLHSASIGTSAFLVNLYEYVCGLMCARAGGATTRQCTRETCRS